MAVSVKLSVSSNGSNWVKQQPCAVRQNPLHVLSVSSNGSNWVKLNNLTLAGGTHSVPFSILERIELGETRGGWRSEVTVRAFSILERIELGETRDAAAWSRLATRAFSILERIELGETLSVDLRLGVFRTAFSILERIELGETYRQMRLPAQRETTFSILERIELGETWMKMTNVSARALLSVSSNGSNWVKRCRLPVVMCGKRFQYPRTDRFG